MQPSAYTKAAIYLIIMKEGNMLNESSIQSSRETPYFVLCLIFSIFVYALAAISIVGIGVALVLFAILLISNLLSNGSIRGNGVRISEHQFGDVYARTVALSNEMGIKKVPDMFVVQAEGMMNAFATRFWGKT
ncbi:hypothetical protein [Bacillus sp. JCM 19041]|uniref:hypothetical protein n=1 Tax=Bacillus sp. JCM 19041 TaxID=1460637 RepID=UPI00336A6C64